MNTGYYQLFRRVNNGEDIHQINLRVVDYARVSTDSIQQQKSFRNQLETYRAMIEENPNWIYVGTYCDHAVTGTKASLRGGFQQMITDASLGKFDLILVKDVARFARNIKECLIYKDKLKSYGVMIYFVKENINSFRCTDELLLQFMALGAEMEAKNARTRTKIVFEQGIQKGKVYGNSNILGYNKQNCSLSIDPYEAKIVKKIFEWYVYQEMGYRRISQQLAEQGFFRKDGSCISARTIKNVLENPKYKGFFCGGKTEQIDLGEKYIRKELPQKEWTVYKDSAIPAIISESLWNQAQLIHKKRAKHFSKSDTVIQYKKYRYSGLIVYQEEKLPYSHYLYHYKNTHREGWQCRNCKKIYKIATPVIYTDEIDPIIQSIFREILVQYQWKATNLLDKYQALIEKGTFYTQQEQLEKQEQQQKIKMKRLLDLYQDTTISKKEYLQWLQEYKQQLKTLQKKKQSILQQEQTTRKVSFSQLQQKIPEILQQLIPNRELLSNMIDKIVVQNTSTKQRIQLEIYLKNSVTTRQYCIIREEKRFSAYVR